MRFYAVLAAVLMLSACSTPAPVAPTIPEPIQTPAPTPKLLFSQEGNASWYGNKHHGKKTANGERFDQNALTAAHRTLPFGSMVVVTNLRNQKSVTVRVNDRGPYSKKRILDVSRQAAEQLGMLKSGTAPIRLEQFGE